MRTDKFANAIVDVWQTCQDSEKVLLSAVLALSDAGLLEKALDVVHQALAIQGETVVILSLLGKISKDMNDFETGEKLFVRLVQVDPTNSEAYAHLVEVLRKQEKNDQALELAQSAVGQFPDNADLWNQLGLLAQHMLNDLAAAKEFYHQALKLSYRNANYAHNLSGVLSKTDSALFWSEAALKWAPHNSQINLSHALLLFAQGSVEDGWRHYEYRKDPKLGSSKASKFDHSFPSWQGESLDGKTIVVCAEQGVGDEVFFLSAFVPLVAQAGQVFVVCDPRLTDIVQRSFPQVVAFQYEDVVEFGMRFRRFPQLDQHLEEWQAKPDYFALFGDVMRNFYGTPEAFMALPTPYLRPSEELVKKYGSRFDHAKKKIGISWRSGNLRRERKRMYLDLQLFMDLSSKVDADFFVLQYTMSEEERAALDKCQNIHCFDDVDLKADIEANLALMHHLDVVIGPPVATQSFAAAAGTPVWLVNKGKPWSFMGQDRLPSYYAEGSRYWCSHDYLNEEEKLVSDLADALRVFEG